MIKTSTTITLQHDSCFAPFRAAEFDEALKWAKECGFDGIELIIAEPKKVDIDSINKKLFRMGLEVSTIATGQSLEIEGLSLTDTSDEIRARTVKRLKEHIELSNRLIGWPNVTVGLLRGKCGANTELQLEMLRIELEKVVLYANSRNVVINLEPINRYETKLLNSCDDVIDFLVSMGNPENVGVLYDTFHSNIEDDDMLKTIYKLKGRISHVHFADSNRRLPGEGHIDFQGVYRALQEIGYRGYVSLETLNLPDANTIKSNAKRSIKAIFCEGR